MRWYFAKKIFLMVSSFCIYFSYFLFYWLLKYKIKTTDLKLIDDDAYIYRDIAENGVSEVFQ